MDQYEGTTIDLQPIPEVLNSERHRNHSRKSEKFSDMLPRKLQGHQATPLVRIKTSRQSHHSRTNVCTQIKAKMILSPGEIIELRYDLIPLRGYIGSSRHEFSHLSTSKSRREHSQQQNQFISGQESSRPGRLQL